MNSVELKRAYIKEIFKTNHEHWQEKKIQNAVFDETEKTREVSMIFSDRTTKTLEEKWVVGQKKEWFFWDFRKNVCVFSEEKDYICSVLYHFFTRKPLKPYIFRYSRNVFPWRKWRKEWTIDRCFSETRLHHIIYRQKIVHAGHDMLAFTHN